MGNTNDTPELDDLQTYTRFGDTDEGLNALQRVDFQSMDDKKACKLYWNSSQNVSKFDALRKIIRLKYKNKERIDLDLSSIRVHDDEIDAKNFAAYVQTANDIAPNATMISVCGMDTKELLNVCKDVEFNHKVEILATQAAPTAMMDVVLRGRNYTKESWNASMARAISLNRTPYKKRMQVISLCREFPNGNDDTKVVPLELDDGNSAEITVTSMRAMESYYGDPLMNFFNRK